MTNPIDPRTPLGKSLRNAVLSEEELLRYMYAHPYYIPIIVAALKWMHMWHREFKWSDVRVFAKDLNKLVIDGIMSRNGNKGYVLADADAAGRAYAKYAYEVITARGQMEMYDRAQDEMPTAPGVPKDIFDDIVGYNDVKKQFMMALNARGNVHILMVGPPSTAKSLFMDALKILPGAKLTYGDAVSKAGLRKFIMDEKPQYLIIDELDKMDTHDDTILLELMEHQTVSVMHYNENEMEDISLRVFAAANDIRRMRRELISRFYKITLKEYTVEEFRHVAYQHLTMKLGTDADMANVIADGVSQRSRDIRDAIRIANMSYTAQDAQFLISKMGHEANV